jgi:hypothetical protein
MRKTKKNKKTTISISLDPRLLDTLNDITSNKSKYVVNCMIKDICKDDTIKQTLKDKKIIL